MTEVLLKRRSWPAYLWWMATYIVPDYFRYRRLGLTRIGALQMNWIQFKTSIRVHRSLRKRTA